MDDSMDWEAAASPSALSAWGPGAASTSSATPYWTASSTPTPHGAIPGVGPFASTTGYIALDTNVLVGQYAVVCALHARLVSAGATTCLLVGQQVMVELDGLSKSGDGELSTAARTAIGWLDDKARGLRLGRGGRLRVESRAERADAAILTGEGVGLPARPDDAVLSSCLYFSRAARVTLWTNDRNLALLAEASGIPTLVGRRVGLPHLLAAAGVPLDADEAMEIDGAILEDDDVDDDAGPMYDRAARNAQVVAAATSPVTPPAPAQTWASTSMKQTWPLPAPDAIAALSSSRVPADVRADVAAELAPALTLLDPDVALPPGTRDVEYARAIADRLAALDASADTPDRRRILARAVASARTLATFLGPEPRRGERRLRSGEAADALTALADALGMMVPLDTARWGPLAARIRQLN